MTTVLLMLGALVVVFGVAALATREGAGMAPAAGDRPDVVLAEGASAADVRAVRFPLAVRGYRMRDVDDVLDRLATALDDRDRRIAVLEGRDEAVPAGAPAEAPVEVVGERPVGSSAGAPVVLDKAGADEGAGSTALPR